MSIQKMKKASTGALSNTLHVVSMQDLNLNVADKKMSKVAFAIWIRSLLQNWRQGTVACKGRSDVARSNKKPWKQKGTGRARAGSARSPLWRGGGVTFGPQPRVRSLSLSRKAKQSVLNTMLFNYMENGRVASLDWALDGDRPKTSSAFNALKGAGLHQHKVTMFLPTDDLLSYASFINIPTVKILFFDQANAYDLADSDSWLVLKKDLNQFKEMVSQWI
jgi:large subunit ribosomal protein L4